MQAGYLWMRRSVTPRYVRTSHVALVRSAKNVPSCTQHSSETITFHNRTTVVEVFSMHAFAQ